jgi:hypothetical protein
MPRKAVEGGTGKRVPLNMKTTEEVRAKLERAAAASGRSLTAEVEYRLEQSFFEQQARNDIMRSLEGKIKETRDHYKGQIAALERRIADLQQSDASTLEEVVERAVEQAVAKALERRNGPEPKNAADGLRNETPKL